MIRFWRIRRFYWRHIRRYHYEICQECGRPVARGISTWWRAPDWMWDAFSPADKNVLCPSCFAEGAKSMGVLIYFEARISL